MSAALESSMTSEHEGVSLSPIAKSNRKKSEENLVASVFTEYCSSTSIHGIAYLGAADKSLAEKIWWVIILVASIICCGILISQTWTKWRDSPVIVSFSQEQMPIWEVPFPAVTICPFNKVRQAIYNYTYYMKKYQTLSPETAKEFWDISLICNLKMYLRHNASKTTDVQAIHSIIKYAPQLDDSVNYYIWKGKEFFQGSEKFAQQITEEGLCYTFNTLNQKDLYTDAIDSDTPYINTAQENQGWTIENGYPQDLPIDTYPERTMEDGLSSGIRLQLFSMSYDRDLVCGDPVSGFKVLLHNPGEVARVAQQYVLAPLNRQVTIAVEPKMITSSRGLLNIPIHTRNCFFAEERQLYFFNFYTQNNCRAECLANVTLAHCSCVPLHLPRAENVSICGFGNLYCAESAHKLIFEYDMRRSKNQVSEKILNSPEYKVYMECDCLPSCSSVDYTTETSQAEFHFVQHFQESEDFDLPLTGLSVTQIDIFFKETQFLALHRSELYGQTDFLANCGGLLGLFMGFSILSLLEIFYFLTIRMWCHARKRWSKNKQSSDLDITENTKF